MEGGFKVVKYGFYTSFCIFELCNMHIGFAKYLFLKTKLPERELLKSSEPLCAILDNLALKIYELNLQE